MATLNQSPASLHVPFPDDPLLHEIHHGLSASPKTLPCKLLYDKRGSELFDHICDLPEYYPTRTEAQITCEYITQITDRIGPDATLIEFGSGSSTKTRAILDYLELPERYVPIDISKTHLMKSAHELRLLYPGLPIVPVHADYCQPMNLPRAVEQAKRKVVYFPGSTIGNFHPHEAAAFMAQMAEIAGPNGGVLMGVDLRKDPAILVPAYDDAGGITAEFNRNLLVRLRDEFGAQLDVDGFKHEARWNEAAGRIEMHLVAQGQQHITLHGRSYHLEPYETIWTESSYKHTPEGFAQLCEGLDIQESWTDRKGYFSIYYLSVQDV